MQLPDTIDRDLVFILGRPNFACSPIAQAMRDDGADIPRRAEDEQAHVIYKFLSLYAAHGANWMDQASVWMEEMQKRLTLKANTQIGKRALIGMSPAEVIKTITDEHEGATIVCVRLIKTGGAIDPDDVLGGMGPILNLDRSSITGPRIWTLYKDVCRENLVDVVGVLRSHQLGHLTLEALNRAIDGDLAAVDVAAELAYVRQRLPKFRAAF